MLAETDVQPYQIGIVSPYAYQVKLLRSMLTHSQYEGLMVDSVERFQGNERRVIVVSTVRNAGMGFLDCEKVGVWGD